MPALPADLTAALRDAVGVPRLVVTSDFDGTLAPIVNDPAAARPLPGSGATLAALAALPGVTAALISGRSRAVLGQLSGAPAGVHLIGSHGAELDTGFGQPIDTTLLSRIHAELQAISRRHPGTAVEAKPASMVLHVRNANPADAAAALAETHAAARGWPAELTEGKAVLEFAVIKTDKGAAVDLLRGDGGASAVVFFGDDVTDEKAFARLRGDDVGVKVGPGASLARFRVEAPADVLAALEFLLRERRAMS